MPRKKTTKDKEKLKESLRKLKHRHYVSMVHNAFQLFLSNGTFGENELFQIYQIDMRIDPDNLDSWDLVLYKECADNLHVDVIFVEVKTLADWLAVNGNVFLKIEKTLSFIKNRNGVPVLNLNEQERIIRCGEFVIAAPPDIIGKLQTKFMQVEFLCPIVLWQIDDSNAVQTDEFVGKVSIPYITQSGIKTYPLCVFNRGDPCTAVLSNLELFTSPPKAREKNGTKFKEQTENLRKNNDLELLSFLNSPNVRSTSLIPGRRFMVDATVNIVALLVSGPLSGQGKGVSKSKNEWIQDISEFFDDFGLRDEGTAKTYGEHYFEIMAGSGILIEDPLNADYFFAKNFRGKPENIHQRIFDPISKFYRDERTRTLS